MTNSVDVIDVKSPLDKSTLLNPSNPIRKQVFPKFNKDQDPIERDSISNTSHNILFHFHSHDSEEPRKRTASLKSPSAEPL